MFVPVAVASASTDAADALSVAVSVPVMVALVPDVTDAIWAPLVLSRIESEMATPVVVDAAAVLELLAMPVTVASWPVIRVARSAPVCTSVLI